MYSQTKRQKFHHFSEALAYPHIPESAQDREENSDREGWQKRPVWRLIESWLFRFSYLEYVANGCCLKGRNLTSGKTRMWQRQEQISKRKSLKPMSS